MKSRTLSIIGTIGLLVAFVVGITGYARLSDTIVIRYKGQTFVCGTVNGRSQIANKFSDGRCKAQLDAHASTIQKRFIVAAVLAVIFGYVLFLAYRRHQYEIWGAREDE